MGDEQSSDDTDFWFQFGFDVAEFAEGSASTFRFAVSFRVIRGNNFSEWQAIPDDGVAGFCNFAAIKESNNLSEADMDKFLSAYKAFCDLMRK